MGRLRGEVRSGCSPPFTDLSRNFPSVFKEIRFVHKNEFGRSFESLIFKVFSPQSQGISRYFFSRGFKVVFMFIFFKKVLFSKGSPRAVRASNSIEKQKKPKPRLTSDF